MNHLRLLAVLALALLAGVAVWTWLPPTGESQAGIRQSIARYEKAARVPYFDFSRRTLQGEVVVKAAADKPVSGDAWSQVYVYRLRQQGDSWEVIERQEAAGPNGGPPLFYDPTTGDFTQDPGA